MPHWNSLSRLSENWLDARPPKFYSVRIRTLIGTTRQPDPKRLTSIPGLRPNRRPNHQPDQRLDQRPAPSVRLPHPTLSRPLLRLYDNARLIPDTPDGGQITA